MFKKVHLLFVVITLASCVPISETSKSKLEFKEKAATKNNSNPGDNGNSKPSSEKPAVTLTPNELKVSVRKILDTNCLSCHGVGQPFQSIANLSPDISDIEKNSKLVIPQDLSRSILYQQVTVGSMKNFLANPKDADVIKAWILSLSLPKVVDTKAPLITSFLPNGSTYESSVTSVKLDVVTDEASSCSFSINPANLDYNKMTKFTTTGAKAHTYTASKLKAGSYNYFVKCIDTAKNISLVKEIKFSIKTVSAPPDTKAPLITSFLPNGSAIAAGITSVKLDVVTDEASICSFSTTSANVDFNQMSKFTVTGDKAHSHTASNLKVGNHSYFVKCQDNAKNVSISKEIKFTTKEVVIVKLTTAELKVAVRKILDTNCLVCHGAGKSFQAIANLAPGIAVIEQDTSLVSPKNLNGSFIYQQVTVGKMKTYLKDPKDADIIKDWILSLVPAPVDNKAPMITSFSPNGSAFEVGVVSAKLSVATDEAASCGFSTSAGNLEYNQMTKFSVTGDKAHSHTAANLKAGSYSYYVKCMDAAKNVSLSKEIKFSIKGVVVPPPVSGFKDYNSEIQMANRSYVESVLLQVFDAEGTPAATYIQSEIYQRIEFGGACDQYSASDIGVSTSATTEFARERCTNSIGVVQPANNNPMRYSLTTKVCERLIADSSRLNIVRNKLFSTQKWGDVTDDKVLVAWHLFHQASDANSDVINSLKNMRKVTSNNDDAWKVIILTLCISPEWQAL